MCLYTDPRLTVSKIECAEHPHETRLVPNLKPNYTGHQPKRWELQTLCGFFEEVSGRKFTVTHVPEEALRAERAAAADSLQEAFAALMLYYAHGDVIDMKPAFGIFPGQTRNLTSVRDHARRLLRAASA